MLLVQKLLNHPVVTLPAWQLEGVQTLLQFFICPQFSLVARLLFLCVSVCIVYLDSSVFVMALLFTPFLSYTPQFLSFFFSLPFFCLVPSFAVSFHLQTFLIFFLLSSKSLCLHSSIYYSPSLSLSFILSPFSASWTMVLLDSVSRQLVCLDWEVMEFTVL